MPDANNDLLQRLSLLIGREGVFEGRRVRVVDVLREDSCLVLSEIGADKMQESLYGQARRRAARHFHIPLQGVDKSQLHPVVRAFLSDDEANVLLSIVR
ncbi:MAG TPA: hypothetical protein ENO09_04205 [bacterium]|nr:hypothetical protein [bacterium]